MAILVYDTKQGCDKNAALSGDYIKKFNHNGKCAVAFFTENWSLFKDYTFPSWYNDKYCQLNRLKWPKHCRRTASDVLKDIQERYWWNRSIAVVENTTGTHLEVEGDFSLMGKHCENFQKIPIIKRVCNQFVSVIV